jgi:hypothetical protein
MQTEITPEYQYSTEVIDFNLKKAGAMQQKTAQIKSKKRACFRTDERYFCRNRNCDWWSECQQLVAEWMR